MIRVRLRGSKQLAQGYTEFENGRDRVQMQFCVSSSSTILNKMLLSTFSVPGSILDTGDSTANKTKIFAFLQIMFY